MEVVQKAGDKNRILTDLFKKFFFIALDYFRFGPLIFVFIYFVVLLVLLLAKTNYEYLLVNILTLLLGKGTGGNTYGNQEMTAAFFRIWFIFGTLFQILNKLFKIRISNKMVFVLISLIFLLLSIVVGIKFKEMGGILIFFYFSTVINLGMFFLFSKGVDFLDKLLNKI